MTDLRPLGIDVAKLTFHACLVRETGKLRHRAFANSAEDKIVDMEIRDESGAKADLQFSPGQGLAAGETKTYTYVWTPT